jgi:hypothetical protein
MRRRTFLRTAGIVGVAGIAGCPSDDTRERTQTHPENATEPVPTETITGTSVSSPATETAAPTSTRGREGLVPLARTEFDVDTSGMSEVFLDISDGENLADVVRGISSGEVMVVPEGRFLWDRRVRVASDNWGIRCHPEAVIEVPNGYGKGTGGEILTTDGEDGVADNFLLENLRFDTTSGRAAPGIKLSVRNGAHVSGLQYEMDGPLENIYQENGVKAYVENPDGELRIDDYHQMNNGDLGGYASGDSRIGLWVGSRNNGTVRVRNPVLQGFPNNGCYVSRQPGDVVIQGGFLVNNNVSAVRVSGGVEVRDAVVYIDIDSYLQGRGVLEGPSHNTRGVWGDALSAGTEGGLVTDSTLVLKSYRRCNGLAAILDNPSMTVRNCRFQLDADIDCVQANGGEISVENCDFLGESRESTAGVGRISGSGNCIVSYINPGAVPVEDVCRRSCPGDCE